MYVQNLKLLLVHNQCISNEKNQQYQNCDYLIFYLLDRHRQNFKYFEFYFKEKFMFFLQLKCFIKEWSTFGNDYILYGINIWIIDMFLLYSNVKKKTYSDYFLLKEK